jgi:membrane associated rhomboid family serine protease
VEMAGSGLSYTLCTAPSVGASGAIFGLVSITVKSGLYPFGFLFESPSAFLLSETYSNYELLLYVLGFKICR